MTDVDLVVRGGTVFNGTGKDGFEADVAVKDGRIVAVEKKASVRGKREIDAKGKIVTPGFVDMHTHYDGQVMWEDTTAPSSHHGVTSVVMGNCGVGFAPCKLEDRQGLVKLMEAVEDIPEAVMNEGMAWSWETFPEYLNALDRRKGDIDIAAQLAHCCLRVYVMGQRGIDREPATGDDLKRMTQISREAMEAGAIGFSTSRTIFHVKADGSDIPSTGAAEAELDAIALGLKQANKGVLQAIIDFDNLEGNVEQLRRVARRSGRPVSYSLAQLLDYPDAWRGALRVMQDAAKEGVEMKGQIHPRPTGMLIGLDITFNPFCIYPTYKKFAHLPLAERVAMMRKPEIRHKLLTETPDAPFNPGLNYMKEFDFIFPLGNPPNYEPSPETSIGAEARRRGVSGYEAAYDMMLENDGKNIFVVGATNYNAGNLDVMVEMMNDPNTVVSLADGGAHYAMVCDSGLPTFMLAHWTRDRKGQKFSVPRIVHELSAKTANAMGMFDRGIIGRGYKADLNVIDYDKLQLHQPYMVQDLPAGARRLMQTADGYDATILSGEVTFEYGQQTKARPGRLIRGQQPAPKSEGRAQAAE